MATATDDLEAFYQFASKLRGAHPDSFSLERAYEAWLNEQWEPETPIAKALKQRRAEYLAAGAHSTS